MAHATLYEITFTPSDHVHMTYKTNQWCCRLFHLATCCARCLNLPVFHDHTRCSRVLRLSVDGSTFLKSHVSPLAHEDHCNGGHFAIPKTNFKDN